jgi:hypothetical protein
MSIQIHIEAVNPSELKELLAGLSSLLVATGGANQAAPNFAEVAATPRKTKEKAAPVAAAAPAPTSAGASASGDLMSQAPAAAPAPSPTVSVGDYIAKIAKVKGKAVAVELLGKYGAKRGQDLKPEDAPKFIAEAKAALGE